MADVHPARNGDHYGRITACHALQLLLGVLGLVRWRSMLGAWRWVVLGSALAGAVLTPPPTR